MKRTEDEVNVAVHTKRPLVSSANGQYQMMGKGANMQKLTTQDALTYLKNVKEIFQDKRETYDEFLKIMKEFKAQSLDTNGVIARVKELFKGYRDLILGFNTFLPRGYNIALTPEDEQPKKTVELGEAVNFINKIKIRFQADSRAFKTFLEILNMYKQDRKSTAEVYKEVSNLFRDHQDLIAEFSHFLPDSSATASNLNGLARRYTSPHVRSSSVLKMHQKHAEEDESIDVVHASRDLGVEHPCLDYNRSISGREKEQQSHSDDVKERRIEGNIAEIKANDRIFERDDNRESNMQQFSEMKPNVKLESSAAVHYIQGEGVGNSLRKFPWNERQLSSSVSVENGNGVQDCEKDNVMEQRDPLIVRTEETEGFGSNDVASHKFSIFPSKHMAKPISELDLSDCEACTPSYRLLPKNYPVLIPSERTEIGEQVLNDHWVSVTSGSEDYSFKHMRKNQYEESLFRCEDDRFELDMLLSSVVSAIQCVEDLLQKIDNNLINKESPFCIKDHMTALNLRCIERLYGEHGIDVVDVLKRNASIALPVILTRLKQKQDEWVRCHSEFNKVWADVYAKNHPKSLDHRSFYFKQQDLKNMTTKGLVAQMKDNNEKKRKEDIILAIGAANRQTLDPDVEFEYPDPVVHEDLRQLIKYSCTPEQLDNVMNVWTTFLEPMFGVSSRPWDSEEIEDATMSKNQGAEHSNEFVGCNQDNPSNNGKHLDTPSAIECFPETEATHVNASDEGGECSRVTPAVHNGLMTKGINSCDGQSTAKINDEREEGEISPNGGYEQDDFELGKEAEAEAEAKNRVEDENVNHNRHDEDGAETRCEAEVIFDARNIYNGSLPFPERYLQNLKPLAKHVSPALQDRYRNLQKNSRVFYGSDSFYVLFVLHQILYERMTSAKTMKWKTSANAAPSNSFPRFLDALHNLLDGSSENTKFEDDCRSIYGTQSYIFFTMDKLIHKFIKQLHTVATDETDNKLLQLYAYEKLRKPGRFNDVVYHDNVRALLHDQNIHRIECSSAPARLSVQLMDSEHDRPEITSIVLDPNFAAYLHSDFLSSLSEEEQDTRIFLKRNRKKFVHDDDDELSSSRSVIIQNGLECKIDSHSSKMSYVIYTEDAWFRSKRRRSNTNVSNGYPVVRRRIRSQRANSILCSKLLSLQ